MFQIKFIEKIILSSVILRKSCRLWDNVGKYGGAGQATDANKIRRLSFVCWILRMCNTSCFSMATVVRRTRLSVKFYLHHLSCSYWAGKCYIDTMYVYSFDILCTVLCLESLIFIATFTCQSICTHQTFVNYIRVSACHVCHHQGVLSLADVAPSEWSVAK
jgi:hypothetical protein